MSRFDLNLITALHALLSERNVTRAAERLNLTQPTVSGMLQRLRHQFGDELLVRNGRHLELTPFGASLVEPAREALCGLELLMRAEPLFDPATSAREFRLMASDYGASIFLPKVVAYVAAHAPGVRLVIRPFSAPLDRMRSGEIDVCISTDTLSLAGWDNGAETLQSEYLFSDDFVCVVAQDHPLDERADLEALLSFPHVGVHMVGTMETIVTTSLRQHAPSYEPNFVVADFSFVPSMVARSNLIGIVQSRLADVAARTLPIRAFAPPFAIPTLNEVMLWHSRHIKDPAHVWLRGVLRDAANVWPDASPQLDQPNRRSVSNGRRPTLREVG